MDELNTLDEFYMAMATNYQESGAFYARKAAKMLQDLETASRYDLAQVRESAKYFQEQSADWYAGSFRLRGLVD